MITYCQLNLNHVNKLQQIDRSEFIDRIYKILEGELEEIVHEHECPTWDEEVLLELQSRFVYELEKGGMAVGAFSGETLVGFGVLAHRFRGAEQNRLQIDLMYVSRAYRRQGIGKRILAKLSEEARRRGAAFLYISSTETRSAVSFYKQNGSRLTDEIDQELLEKEPHDIHMVIEL